MAFETWGRLDADGGNGVLVLHALTGDSHASANPGHGQPGAGWWEGMIGPGAPIDTDRYFVVCPNVLGGCQGTTGPASPAPDGSPYGSRFPLVTIRDQVAVEAALADHLGIERWAGVVGGSMGGMRVLEWCVGRPRPGRAGPSCWPSAPWPPRPRSPCARCRSGPSGRTPPSPVATTTSPAHGRTPASPWPGASASTATAPISSSRGRFGRGAQAEEDPSKGGRFAVESYLEYHGDKLARRFDPNSYIVLSEAMNHHDVGRGRNGVARALAGVRAEVTVAGIDSDRLYPLGLQYQLARLLPGDRPVTVIESASGHDGFLLELDQVGAVVASALA